MSIYLVLVNILSIFCFLKSRFSSLSSLHLINLHKTCRRGFSVNKVDLSSFSDESTSSNHSNSNIIGSFDSEQEKVEEVEKESSCSGGISCSDINMASDTRPPTLNNERVREKIALKPGFHLMDWMRLMSKSQGNGPMRRVSETINNLILLLLNNYLLLLD